MKHHVPFVLSLLFTASGSVLLLLGLDVAGQALLVPAFVAGLLSFKRNAWIVTAAAHALPAFVLAGFYFTPDSIPLLTVALLLAGVQNTFLEIFFPSRMYNNSWFKVSFGIVALGCLVAGNLLFPAGWQAWVFPGLILLAADILSVYITRVAVSLVRASGKGLIVDTGSACPDFTLMDETGSPVSAADFRGRFLLLVFVRGDWCPGCHIMLRTYQRNKERLAERGVHLLSIGPDPLGVNKEMVQKLGLTYHVLSDEGQKVAQQFCVELQEHYAGVPDYDFVPLPASFLIDKAGVVRYTSRADVAGEILYPERIFEVLASLN